MAQIPYRVNLSASTFPLISSLFGRSVIVSERDQNYIGGINPKDSISEAYGIPQIYFAENIVPTPQGVQSVAYKALLPSLPGLPDSASVNEIREIVSTDGFRIYLVQATNGTVYVTSAGELNWRTVTTMDPSPLITVATINGVSYIWFQNEGVFQYDYTENELLGVTFTGLEVDEIVGIISANGYIIAYSKESVAWSSTVDITDFVPSLITGAGGGNVQEAEGEIVAAVPTTLGFIVYTTKNAVSVTYSGNSRYPFNFRGISGSGGISSLSEVAIGSSTGEQYAYTTSGLQKISHVKAETLLAYVTDFISGGVIEEYDRATDTFTVTQTGVPLKKRIALISDRYLLISYGRATVLGYSHVIMIDLSQSRMGRLKFGHMSAFELTGLGASTRNLAKESIAFLGDGGAIYYLSFNYLDPACDGALFLGKYQLTRTRFTQLFSVDMESIQVNPLVPFSAQVLTTLNGKTEYEMKDLFLEEQSGDFRRYLSDAVGLNVSLVLKGAFNLTSLELALGIHGRM